MKRSNFTDEQIAFAWKLAETGTKVSEVGRRMSISDATFLYMEEEIRWPQP